MGRPEQPPFISIGQRFARWTVVEEVGIRRGRRWWLCRCFCGTTRELPKHQLIAGVSRSCGCLQREVVSSVRRAAATHGHARTGKRSSEYLAWRAMINRCCNPSVAAYPDYGGRGITICPRWRDSFSDFLEDVGHRPDAGASLGRIDNDKGYHPGNVRWETKSEQARNRRSNRQLTWNGVSALLIEWAHTTGIKRTTIMQRLARGWSTDRTLSTPTREQRPKR